MANKYQEWMAANPDKKGTQQWTDVEAAAKLESDMPTETPFDEGQSMSWGDVAYGAVTNFPESFGNIVHGLAMAVNDPVNTAKSFYDVAGAITQSAINLADPEDKMGLGRSERFQQVSDALAQFYGDRYGSVEGFKKAFSTDPAGVLTDASTILFGGSLALRGGQMPGLAAKAETASKVTDPLGLAVSAAGQIPRVAEEVGGTVLGTTTGAGKESVIESFQSGLAGGERGRTFRESMRGKIATDTFVDVARQNLAAMRQKMKQAYGQQKDTLFKNDRQVLSFNDVDNAYQQALKLGMYKGQVKNESVIDALTKVKAEIERWRSYPSKEYHTPEGMDALREAILAVKNQIPFENRPAQAAVQAVYAELKKSIEKQSPGYSRMLRDYAEGSELLTEIQKTFSLGPNANPETAIRKLQSLMRNNVNTSYGRRMELASIMEQEGGRSMVPMAAGMQMSSPAPRSLASVPALGGAGAAFYTGEPMIGAGLAAASSPRLVGETAHKAGQLANIATGGAPTRQGISYLYNLLNRPGVTKLFGQTGLLMDEERQQGILGQ